MVNHQKHQLPKATALIYGVAESWDDFIQF